ncbi:MAG TPA: mechanosensitive ion channel domain-containing protein [Alphaproteobacteria bacterium]|jgi:small-conductance mechanosensitive channel|nr:mechanosensitive ion channel domain-containing protein [Alphaproteobacteria bacterium]
MLTEHLPHWVADATARLIALLQDRTLLLELGVQAVYILGALLLMRLAGYPLKRLLAERLERMRFGPAHQLLLALLRVVPWLILLLLVWAGRLAFHEAGRHARLLHLAENLALAWVVIRFTSGLVRNHRIATAIAIAAWLLAALNIVGLLDPAIHLMDSMGVTIGHFRLSLLLVVKSIIFLTVLLWAANISSRVIEQRLTTFQTMAPAMQVLAAKLAKVVLITLAVVIALNAVGIDLTAFAVFSGAIGVGIGFGLQKVVSNLISGVILLLDRSIKPGDVIEIAGTYGWITRLNARFVSVSTRDGIEHLIPNEDLITQRVTNWSYSDEKVRLHVPVGIGYRSDVRQAMALCIESAKDVKRVLEAPAPICLLKGFGDSSIDLELRFWIRDPRNGTANVRSEVMLGIWDRFRENDIELPFPQRDLHIPDMDKLVELLSARFAQPPPRTQADEPDQD